MILIKGFHYFLCEEVSKINKNVGTVFVLFILHKSLRTEGGCPKSFAKILSVTLQRNYPKKKPQLFSRLLLLFNVFCLYLFGKSWDSLSAFAVGETLKTKISNLFRGSFRNFLAHHGFKIGFSFTFFS